MGKRTSGLRSGEDPHLRFRSVPSPKSGRFDLCCGPEVVKDTQERGVGAARAMEGKQERQTPMCAVASSLNSRRDSQRDVPVSLQISGVCAGRAITLYSARAWKDGLTLVSPEYIRPRSVIDAVICVPGESEPLRAFLSVIYVQRSLRGYGIGVQFVGLSDTAQARWNRLIGLSRGLYARLSAKQSQVPQTPRVLLSPQSLSQRAQLSLQEQSLDLVALGSAQDLIRIASLGLCAQLLVDLAELNDSWMHAIAQARCLVPSLQLWLFTSRDSEESLAKGLALGACVVVAKPCSHEVLATQLRSEHRRQYSVVPETRSLEHPLHA